MRTLLPMSPVPLLLVRYLRGLSFLSLTLSLSCEQLWSYASVLLGAGSTGIMSNEPAYTMQVSLWIYLPRDLRN